MCLITCNQLQCPWHSRGSSHGTPHVPKPFSWFRALAWSSFEWNVWFPPTADAPHLPQHLPILFFSVCNSVFCTLGIYFPSSLMSRGSHLLFSFPCVKQHCLSCLYILCSVSLYHCTFLDCTLKISGNIFSPLVFLLDTACALPWYTLHIYFWLFQVFSSLDRLPRTCFSTSGLFLLCVHFKSALIGPNQPVRH